jgi:hypothetical protein
MKRRNEPMVKGGVYFLDLTAVEIGGDSVTITGIWDSFKRTYGKIIYITVDIGDGAIMKVAPAVTYETDVIKMKVFLESNGVVFSATVSITDDDSVQIAVNE